MSKNRKPCLEVLEDRCLPSNNTISGFVYQDANNNGLFDSSEMPIANVNVQLKNANNVVVATAITNAQGYYEFKTDSTVNIAPATLTKTVTFQNTQTNFSLNDVLGKFDPSLGQLTSIEIIHNGTISSEIKVENTSPSSGSSITANVSGTLTLTVGGVTSALNPSQNVGTMNAQTFDGAIDFGGLSGTSFGVQSASDSKTITLTGSAMNPFIGTGTLSLNETAQATSSASGGGNLVVSVNSSGSASITVKYHYLPGNGLVPGNYTIIESQPSGYLDGKESSGGVVLNTVPGSDVIPVALTDHDMTHNDFGEVLPNSVSGFVYHDVNNNGVKDPGEAAISGVSVNLTGTDDLGPVSKGAVTDGSGFYQFTGLRPGNYTLTETQPSGWLEGKITPGSLSGTPGNDVISNINMPQGGQSINNLFGELKPSSLAGYVWVDGNNNGVLDNGETGISGAQVTLSGTSDTGPVSTTATTDSNGFYQFNNLRPGTYKLAESQPAGYLNGKTVVGSPGGNQGNDTISNILVLSDTNGTQNNFGELNPAAMSGHVWFDANNDGVMDPGEQPIGNVTVTLTGTDDLGPVSKTTVTNSSGLFQFNNLRPGNYTLSETQPSGWLQGKNSIGTMAGDVQADQMIGIAMLQGSQSLNNNFGELMAAKLSGHVYIDTNNNGIRETGEQGIPGVTVTLTGTDDNGPVTVTAVTDPTGAYQFVNLRPGTYTITETQPAAYDQGKNALGTLNGVLGADVFSAIVIVAGNQGQNYDFGERIHESSDLKLVKSVSSTSVMVGSTVTYTITITNLGPTPANGVTVTDNLPPDAIFVSAAGPGWTIVHSGLVLTATTAKLPTGVNSVITITVKAPAVATTLTNTATVIAETPDPTPNNNTSTVTTTVYNTPGDAFPKTLTPLVTSFGALPVISKAQLLGSTIGNTSKYLNPTTKAQMSFLDGVYRTLLGRAATTAEFQAGVQQLNSGVSRQTIVARLWNTDKHRGMQIDQFYRIFLGRNPTAGERASGILALKTGTSETDLAVQFMSSLEYAQTHPSANTLVAGFFVDLYGRTPDASTQLLLVQAMDEQPVSEIARSLILSDEGVSNIIDNGYRAMLRRPATSTEIAYWSSQLQSGQLTPGAFMQQLLASDDFYQLALRSAH